MCTERPKKGNLPQITAVSFSRSSSVLSRRTETADVSSCRPTICPLVSDDDSNSTIRNDYIKSVHNVVTSLWKFNSKLQSYIPFCMKAETLERPDWSKAFRLKQRLTRRCWHNFEVYFIKAINTFKRFTGVITHLRSLLVISNLSHVFSPSRIGYHASKPMVSVVHCFKETYRGKNTTTVKAIEEFYCTFLIYSNHQNTT